MTFVPEQLDKHDECSCCGKRLQAGDGYIFYEKNNLTLALGSCCAFDILSSLIQDAEMASKSSFAEAWMRSITNENGEKLLRFSKAANGLAEELGNWAKIEDNYAVNNHMDT